MSINNSKNKGNYNHFINVISALARLIIYFKSSHNVNEVFGANSDGLLKLHEQDRSLFVYRNPPDMRTFKLMLAGFYHDLGKTITDPRHPMEGAMILASHTTEKRLMLDSIAKSYRDDFGINRDDFLYIADLVLFHDLYGTLSTGEDGYMTLVYAIDKIKRYSLNPDQDIDDTGTQSHIDRCKKYLFDLWLLNVADIMVSLKDKWKPQEGIWNLQDKAEEEINKFFCSEKGARLRHDFEITFDILKKYTDDGKLGHCDDLNVLNIEAHNWSKRHSIERLRRLVTETLGQVINEMDIDGKEKRKKINEIKENIKKEKVDELLKLVIKEMNIKGDENLKKIDTIRETIEKEAIKEEKVDELLERVKEEMTINGAENLKKIDKIRETIEKEKVDELLERVIKEMNINGDENLKKIDKIRGTIEKERVDEIKKIDNAYKILCGVINELKTLPEAHWNLLITRSIQSVADFDDFTTRLSWIGKMDYALGFFIEILKQALYQVSYEIIDNKNIANQFFGEKKILEPTTRTGWIRVNKTNMDVNSEYYYNTQAVFFSDNFVATMIQVLEYLLFRERAIDRLRNIEFSDTKNRLTKEKLNQLLCFEGPYRARRSIQAILQTIYLY